MKRKRKIKVKAKWDKEMRERMYEKKSKRGRKIQMKETKAKK